MRNRISLYRARSLRNATTDTERYLWQRLRLRQLDGFRFRRQAPIGRYVADFVCLEAKLVIELDGGQHQQQSQNDKCRDGVLERQGYRVLRFWDNEVFQQTDAVLEKILHVLRSLPREAGEG